MREHERTILSYMNARLIQWAKWYTHYGDFGLGFPRRSREGQLVDSGGLLIRSTAPYFPSNAIAEETELLVKELSGQNFKLAVALKEYYFGEGNIIRKARRVGVPASHFKIYVESAKQWLIGRLSLQKPWQDF